MNVKEIFNDMFWVGKLAADPGRLRFTMGGRYGVSHNSYLLKGAEKSVVFQIPPEKEFDCFLENIKALVQIKDIGYIVLHHLEPDQIYSIEKLWQLNPEIKLAGTVDTLTYLTENSSISFNTIAVNDGDILNIGNKVLRFLTISNQTYNSRQSRWNNDIKMMTVPNFQWIDTLYTYIEADKALITCDAFSAHYLCEDVINENICNQEEYEKALRSYFDSTAGLFKSHMLKTIKKLAACEIDVICPGYGPVLAANSVKLIEMYKNWLTFVDKKTKKTLVMPYVSVYGYTRMLAEKIAEGIRSCGDIEVKLIDIEDISEAEADQITDLIGLADGVLFGTPTIKGEAPMSVWNIVNSMVAMICSGKIASVFGSYGWSGEGVPHIIARLHQLKMQVYKSGFTVRLKPDELQLAEAFKFGYGFGMSVKAGKLVEYKAISKKATTDLMLFETSENYVVVGNGAAGVTACKEIRKRNRNCHIELISKDKNLGYIRHMLYQGIFSEIEKAKLLIQPEEWYEKNNISLVLGVEVTEIKPDAKTVILSDGRVKKYDKLILAAGAQTHLPMMKGIGKKGVFTVHTLEDLNLLRDYMKRGINNAVIVGGGIMGLETAWKIKKPGVKITIIESQPTIMAKQLDKKGAEYLQTSIEKSGMNVITGKRVTEILGDSTVTGLTLSDGMTLDTELVIICTGVKANVELVKNTGIHVGNSIIVNEKMETGVQDIYACGDCAEFNSINHASWPQALEMASVAAINAVGGQAVYEHSAPVISFTGMNTCLFSIGDNGKNQDKVYTTKEYDDKEKHVYEKLYFTDERFCGGILIGNMDKTTELLDAFLDKRTISKMYL